MIDPDLKTQFDQINQNLVAIEKKKGSGIWRSFFNGMFSALGYVAGLAIVVVILGWLLQKTGLLQPFQEQVKNFTSLVDEAKKLIPSDNPPAQQKNSLPSNNSTNSGTATSSGEQNTTVTLPSGQQIHINLSQ